MSDNLSEKGPRDAIRINVNEDWELKYWGKKFVVTEEELKAAVRQPAYQLPHCSNI